MPKRVLLPLLIAVLLIACKKTEEPAVTATVVSETVVAAPSAIAASPTTTVAAPAPTPAAPPGTAIASQETNWKGLTAEVTEFRRKGNTLTAKVRFTNRGSEVVAPDVMYAEVSLVDTSGGKKYEVLKDEKNVYLAYLKQGWNYRWYDNIKPNDSMTIWMKFPAPPAEVKAITLQLPGMAPFEDVPIQD